MQQCDLQGNVWNLGINGSESKDSFTSVNYIYIEKLAKVQELLHDFYQWYGGLPSTDEKIDNEVLSRIENMLEVVK